MVEFTNNLTLITQLKSMMLEVFTNAECCLTLLVESLSMWMRKSLEILVDDPFFNGHPAAIAPEPPTEPKANASSRVERRPLPSPPPRRAQAKRLIADRPGLSPNDDNFRKAAGTTRWMRPRADFLDRRLSKLS